MPSSPSLASPRQLQVQALHLGHGDWQLCRGWSQAWAPGLHLLRGGDGAGKSSLLRVLAGMQSARAGQVGWSDQKMVASDVFWVDPRFPEQKGATEGTPQQWATRQAQAYPRWDVAQWRTHIEYWQLQADVAKPWHALSTGTARKLWMAAALSSGADLVLIDEPVAGLDRPSIAYLRQVLAERAQGAQWVLVAHFDDLQGLPWDSVLDLEELPQE
ncbi:MAG: ATP-binding cassette domain-containing protein [Comamonas sp.]